LGDQCIIIAIFPLAQVYVRAHIIISDFFVYMYEGLIKTVREYTLNKTCIAVVSLIANGMVERLDEIDNHIIDI